MHRSACRLLLGCGIILSLVRLSVAQATKPTDERPMAVGGIADRPDRLISLTGNRSTATVAEFSIDSGRTWNPATVYIGTTTDEWRGCDAARWNKAVTKGRIPAGRQTCLWDYFFDLDLPTDGAILRVRTANDDRILLKRKIDFKPVRDVVVIDHRNVTTLAGGKLPKTWDLRPGGKRSPAVNSIHCTARTEETLLSLKVGLKGWYRIYVGMEPYSTFRFSLSRDDVRYAVPNYYTKAGGKSRLLQEFFIGGSDMTGQDICLRPGGSRFWRDVSIRYIRLVPMTRAEVDRFGRIRDLAGTKGRAFVGYLEPCTPAYYEPACVRLRDHIRNQMRLNKARGSTDVYVHAIRIGCKAYYHSDVVERMMPREQDVGKDLKWLHFTEWMEQGDPMAVAVTEARAAGLKVFADAGMNATYVRSAQHYKVLTERFAREHPECLCPGNKNAMDYRKKPVRAYVTSVVRELMTKYDVDGVNLDFARWGHRPAFDVPSMVAVLEQVNKDRQVAEKKWGHRVVISARIDYDPPPAKGAVDPVFLGALKGWAKAGLVDRIMANVFRKLSPTIPVGHYLDAISGTRAKLWADMYWGTWHKNGGPAADLAIARGLVKQGLNGGFYYYMRARPTEFEQINRQMRLIDFPEIGLLGR